MKKFILTMIIALMMVFSANAQIATENAKFFEENNAAMVLLGDDADSEHLKNALTKMLDKTTRKAFADSCSNMVDKIPPARKIADLIFMGVVSK